MKIKGKDFKEHTSGLYISMDGEVFVPRNCNYKEHFTYGSITPKGYLRVKRNNKNYLVHRLVAECYIPNIDNLPQVNHKDENKMNNCVDNLEWCDAKYNCNYGTRLERIDYNSIAKKKSKKVLQISIDGKIVKEWESLHNCAKYGFDYSNIGSCCRGERKTHKGYKWQYA